MSYYNDPKFIGCFNFPTEFQKFLYNSELHNTSFRYPGAPDPTAIVSSGSVISGNIASGSLSIFGTTALSGSIGSGWIPTNWVIGTVQAQQQKPKISHFQQIPQIKKEVKKNPFYKGYPEW